MMPFIKKQLRRIRNSLPLRWICKWEFQRQRFLCFNERPVEFAFVFRQIARVYPRKILDVGTGTTALPHLMRYCGPLVTATDNVRDYWPEGMSNRHYHVIDDDITNSRIRDTFDLITCVSVLEHIRKHKAAMRNMFRLLSPDGHLALTFPYSEDSYVEDVYALSGSAYRGQGRPYICQSYSRKELDGWLRDNRGVIVEQEYWQFWDGEYWTVGDRMIPPRRQSREERHQLTCVLIRKGTK